MQGEQTRSFFALGPPGRYEVLDSLVTMISVDETVDGTARPKTNQWMIELQSVKFQQIQG